MPSAIRAPPMYVAGVAAGGEREDAAGDEAEHAEDASRPPVGSNSSASSRATPIRATTT